MHQGPIHEFTLSMIQAEYYAKIDYILLHLSKKNTLKKFTLDIEYGFSELYMLPISFFSLHQLTEMHLEDFVLSHKPSFYDFGCLTTLYMQSIWTCDKKLLRFLSGCSSLKRLTLVSS